MRLPAFVFLFALLPILDCGGSDSKDSPCDGVCDCVKSLGGDRATCLKECKASTNTTSDTCRSQLQSYGYSSCNSHCDVFGTGGAGGNPGTGGGPAGTGGTPVRDGGAGGPNGTGGVPVRDGSAGGPAGGGGGPPGGAGGGPPGGAGGGTATGGAYTLTACPGVTVTPGITGSYPDCSSTCAAAHCVPTDLVGPRADTLPDCPDATSKCVPDAMAEANSHFVFKGCTSPYDPNREGSCVPICVAGSSASLLQRDVCGPNELCAPCFDTTTQAETGACDDFCAP